VPEPPRSTGEAVAAGEASWAPDAAEGHAAGRAESEATQLWGTTRPEVQVPRAAKLAPRRGPGAGRVRKEAQELEAALARGRVEAREAGSGRKAPPGWSRVGSAAARAVRPHVPRVAEEEDSATLHRAAPPGPLSEARPGPAVIEEVRRSRPNGPRRGHGTPRDSCGSAERPPARIRDRAPRVLPLDQAEGREGAAVTRKGARPRVKPAARASVWAEEWTTPAGLHRRSAALPVRGDACTCRFRSRGRCAASAAGRCCTAAGSSGSGSGARCSETALFARDGSCGRRPCAAPGARASRTP
jgi:hypothetical protein